MPIYTTWDDHDLVDNYCEGNNTRIYRNARWAFDRYAASVNPDPPVKGQLFYEFSVGNVDFFVLDTRSFRDCNEIKESPGS